MTIDTSSLQIRIAEDEADLLAAQRLRYRVFVEELKGGGGAMVDHANRLERDHFDPFNDHLILVDPCRDAGRLDHVVGVYRLLRDDRAAEAGRFYCDDEYDLTALKRSGRRLLELGRSCVDEDYRGGAAMLVMWNWLANYVLNNGIEILFGVASFHGTDVKALEMPLSWLHHHHLAPPELRVRALAPNDIAMDLVPDDRLERNAAMEAMPALIKAYLRLGGFVGEGAYVDHGFNTTDVCLLMDTAAMSQRHRSFYTRKHKGTA
ncbi:MAG: GNAT family N-acetyltransferase [Rhodobacteraceae bacterium]|nr:GNAT family N-acetyltransferase [Paracoccaceae bacterium]